MRDIKRIKPFMEKLTQLWESYPDMKFEQIIYILAEKIDCRDIFFPEEDKWIKAIDEELYRR